MLIRNATAKKRVNRGAQVGPCPVIRQTQEAWRGGCLAGKLSRRLAIAGLVGGLIICALAQADLGTFYQIGEPETGQIMPVFPADDRRMMEPVHDVITPHVPLVPHLPGGPVRVLAIANYDYGRWPLELKQRLDMELTVVYTRSRSQFGFPSGWIGMRAEDVTGRLLQALSRQPEVIISETQFTVLPEVVQRRLREHIAAGAGFVGYLDGLDLQGYKLQEDKQQALLAKAVPFALLRQLRARFATPEEAAKDVLTLYEKAQAGRLAALWDYPRDDAPPDPGWLVYDWLPRMEEEAWNSLLAHVVLWAAKRPATGLDISLPAMPVERARLPFSLQAHVDSGSGSSRLEMIIWDRAGRQQHQSQIKVKSRQMALKLPLLPAGEYAILVRLWEQEAVRDWTLQALQIKAPVEIAGITLAQRVVEHDAPVAANISLSGAPAPGQKLLVEIEDNFGRIVQRRMLPAAPAVAVSLSTEGSRHLYNYVNVKLLGKEGAILHEARHSFIIRHPPPPADELVVKMWAAIRGGGQTTGRFWQRNWKHAQDGVDVDRGDTPEAAAIYNMRSEVQAANMRQLKLIEPTATPEVNTRTVQAAAQKWGAYPLYHYHLGDDFSYPENWTPAARAYLAQWAQKHYEDLQHLNQAWGTSYNSFEQVEPIDYVQAARELQAATPQYGALCHWVDQQLAREDMLIEFIRTLQEALQAVDPRHSLAIQNTIVYPAPNTGFNYWKLAQVFGDVGAYANPMTLDVYRSARQPGRRLSVYSGSYGVFCFPPYQAMEMLPWWAIFRQMNALNYWYGASWQSFPGVLAPDLGPLHGYAKALEGIRELRAGIAKLLLHAERQNDGVAVLHSQGSINATAFLGAIDKTASLPPLPQPPEWSGVWASGDAHVYMNSWEGLTALLRDIGFSYEVISEDSVKQGVLSRQRFRLLVLPLCIRLDEEAARAIREFVRAGGIVLADFAPGLFNGVMRPEAPGVLADVFGVRFPGGMPQMALEKVELNNNFHTRGNENKGEIAALGNWLSAVNLTPAGATALAHTVKGAPVLLTHNCGLGKAILLNMLARDYQIWRTLGQETPFRQSVAALLKEAGLTPRIECTVHAGRHGKRPLPATERVRFIEGEIEYIGILRDFALRPDERILFSDTRAHPTAIDFGRHAHVYDVRRGDYRGYRRVIEDMIHPGQAKLYALLPYEVRRLEAQAAYRQEGGKSWLDIQARLLTADNSVPGRHVFHLEVKDARGCQRREYAENCLGEHGAFSQSLLLGYDPLPGLWQITLKDVASGAHAEISVPVGP